MATERRCSSSSKKIAVCIPRKCSLSNCATRGLPLPSPRTLMIPGQHLCPCMRMAHLLVDLSSGVFIASQVEANCLLKFVLVRLRIVLGGLRHGVNLTRLREKLSNTCHKSSGLRIQAEVSFAIVMRLNQIENLIRFGPRSTEIFGRFGCVFRFNFRSRARSSSVAVESNRNSVC